MNDRRRSMLVGGPGELRFAEGCICGKHMLVAENAGTCLWCGRGRAYAVNESAYKNLLRQPPLPSGERNPVKMHHVMLDEDGCIAAYHRWAREHGRIPTALDWQMRKNGDGYRPSFGTIKRKFGSWSAFKRAIAEVPREQVA